MYKQGNLSFSVVARAHEDETSSIQFSTQDKNSAKLVFTIKEGKSPLNLSDVDGFIDLVMGDKSIFEDNKAVVVKPLEGVLEYTITPEQIRHPGKARGELQLVAKNGQSIGGFRFNFTIKKALVDEYAGQIKEFYIEDLEAVKKEVQKKADAVVLDIDNFKIEVDSRTSVIEEQLNSLDEDVSQSTVLQVDTAKGEHANLDARIKSDVGKLTSQLAENNQYQASNVSYPSILNVDIANVTAKLENNLTLPVYTGEEAVHPSILHFPNGWNGHKYCMGVTPYENTDNQKENPSFFCSQDGIDWYVPSGGKNPLIATPPNGGYNSDPVLFLDKDGVTLHMMYRECFAHGKPSDERLYVISTKDGKTWTDPVLSLGSNSDISRPISPAVRWNGNEYLLWYNDIKTSPKKVYVRKSNNPYGGWSEPYETNITVPTGRQIWHLDIIYYQGVYFLLLQDDTSDGASGYLYIGTSTDGIQWVVNQKPILTGDGKMYKSCLYPLIKNNVLTFSMWYTTFINNKWKIGYTILDMGNNQESIQELKNTVSVLEKQLKYIQAINKMSPYVLADTFDRADSTTGLGVATTGQTWSTSAGVFGISNGVAYPTSDANTRTTIESGLANGKVEVLLSSVVNQAWIVFRFLDSNNYLRGGFINGYLNIQKIENGASTALGNASSYIPKANDIMEIAFNDDNITLNINGINMISASTPFGKTNTKTGLQAVNTGTKFDNFIVSRIT